MARRGSYFFKRSKREKIHSTGWLELIFHVRNAPDSLCTKKGEWQTILLCLLGRSLRLDA